MVLGEAQVRWAPCADAKGKGLGWRGGALGSGEGDMAGVGDGDHWTLDAGQTGAGPEWGLESMTAKIRCGEWRGRSRKSTWVPAVLGVAHMMGCDSHRCKCSCDSGKKLGDFCS